MRRIEVTVEEAQLARSAVTEMIEKYLEAVERYSTIEYQNKIDQGTLDAWRHNAEVLRKLRAKLA